MLCVQNLIYLDKFFRKVKKYMQAASSITDPPIHIGKVGYLPTREPANRGLREKAAAVTEVKIPSVSP